jgi:hypothetical protein
VPSTIEALVSRIRGGYADAIPLDTKEAIRLFSKDSPGIFLLSIRKFVRFLNRLAVLFKVLKMGSLSEIKGRLDYKVRMSQWRQLPKEYEELSRKFRRPSKFVYFLLNFQPENTTSPLGNEFVDQYLAVAMLRRHLPKDFQIVIKEHPGQFLDFGHYNHIGRDHNYYVRLAALDNVVFAPFDSDHFDLIDSSYFVSCVNGTVGWEALVRGKKSIIFGEAWYQSAPGVYKVTSDEECISALKEFEFSNSLSNEVFMPWLSKFLAGCVNFYVNEDDARLANDKFNFPDNVEKIKIALRDRLIG